MVELGSRRTTERVRDGNSPPKAARAVLLSQPRVLNYSNRWDGRFGARRFGVRVAYRLRITEPGQQDPATALVVRLDELSRSLSSFIFRTPFSPGRGALGCYRVAPSALQNLEPPVPAPSGCGPFRSNPIFVFLWWIDLDFFHHRGHRAHRVLLGFVEGDFGQPGWSLRASTESRSETGRRFLFSVSSVPSVVRKSGFELDFEHTIFVVRKSGRATGIRHGSGPGQREGQKHSNIAYRTR